MRLHSFTAFALALVLAWGFWDSWFETGSQAPDAAAVQTSVAAVLADAPLHPATREVYDDRSALWTSASARHNALSVLRQATLDGIGADDIQADAATRAVEALDAATASWQALDDAARDTLVDPRPARIAQADVALSDATLRLGDALRGRRTDASKLYPGTWFPVVRDTSNTAFFALGRALQTGSPQRVAGALNRLRPQHDGYRRLRTRLGALSGFLAPIPDGSTLVAGGRSVRVPHLRERLDAYGYTRSDTLDAWTRPDPYLFDDSLASALSRFEQSHHLPVNRALEAADTEALNADPAALRARLALNLERWRWLPDTFGDDFVWVNIPSFELRVVHVENGREVTRLEMPVNVGNALTRGWTTPVIRDSVHTVEFHPAWYVPASLTPGLFAQARADSLSLFRQGFDVTLNGRAVDSRLVQWDSVSSAGFRYVQRPGPANPLGRVKFRMHNPYAILIHDTNKPTLRDGRGESMSSGCVQAGAPDKLAEYLMTTVNGWEPGRAERAYRRGPRQGVRLERPFATEFVYFTATVDADGQLRLFDDTYGYDARLARALGLTLTEAPDESATEPA